jgi:hypothetical protein
MSEIQYVGVALVGALVLYQMFVSIIIFRADEYGSFQRIVQLVIVWLMPLFGAIGCHMFLRSQRAQSPPKDYRFVPQEPNGDP